MHNTHAAYPLAVAALDLLGRPQCFVGPRRLEEHVDTVVEPNRGVAVEARWALSQLAHVDLPVDAYDCAATA